MSSRSAPAWSARALVPAIAIVACLAYLAGGRHAVGIADRDYLFSPADAPEAQLDLPTRDVPFETAPTISSLAGRFAFDVALGRRTALRDLAAVSAALAIGLFGAWLLTAGVAAFPVMLTMVAMTASRTFWNRGIAWTWDALYPSLLVIAIWSGWRYYSTRRPGFGALAVITLAIAAVDSPPWVTIGRGLLPLEAQPSIFNVLITEFTPLGLALAAIGTIALLQSVRVRIPVLMTAAALIGWQLVRPRSPLDTIGIALAFAGWAAVAVGLEWLQRVVPRSAGVLLVGAAGVMLFAEPALTRVRLSALGRDLPSELRTRMAADLRPEDLPDHGALVAEARDADAAVLLAAARTKHEVLRLPQDPDRLIAAMAEGAVPIAFDNARANLERLGFLFEREWAGYVPVGVVVGQVPCARLEAGTWTDVTSLIESGSFYLHGITPATPPGATVLRTATGAEVSTVEPRGVSVEVTDGNIRILPGGRRGPISIALSPASGQVTATAESGGAAQLCAGVPRGPLMLGRSPNATASVRMNDAAPFGTGWHPVEADPDFFRWTSGPDALVRVSVAPPGAVRVTITATPAARPAQSPSIAIAVNQCRLPSQPMQSGQGDYEWIVGAECWRAGTNALRITVSPLISPAELFASHDTRLLGARIGAIRLARQ